MKLKPQIENLMQECFKIEKQLPMFVSSKDFNEPREELRRDLYRLRIQLNSLKIAADIVDDLNEKETV